MTILDPRQTYISREVEIDRIGSGSILYPGTRLTGKRTFVGSYAKIGTEGPAAVSDSVIGPHAEVASGFFIRDNTSAKGKGRSKRAFFVREPCWRKRRQPRMR